MSVDAMHKHLLEKIRTKEKELEAFNVSYYMYEDSDIVQQHAKEMLSKRKGKKLMLKRYHRDALAEVEILDALASHSLRTLNPQKADFFVIPTSVAAILTTFGGDAKRVYPKVFDTLLETPTFKATQGHRHILMALVLPIFSPHHRRIMKSFGLSQYYGKLANVTIATDCDAAGMKQLADSDKNDTSDYAGAFKNLPVSSKSFSMGLMSNSEIPFHAASFKKFTNSSYFVFYHTRTNPSLHNSTIYRQIAVTKNASLSLPRSSIGYDISKDEWLSRYVDSKFCLCIRGDTPHTHALSSSVKVGCIPVIVCDSYPLYAPTLKSSVDMSDYAVILDENKFVEDPVRELKKLQDMTDLEIQMKLKALALAQRVLVYDHPDSLFVPAFIQEAAMLEGRILGKF